jgi:hypothetical protein
MLVKGIADKLSGRRQSLYFRIEYIFFDDIMALQRVPSRSFSRGW